MAVPVANEEIGLAPDKADIILRHVETLQGQVTEVYREVGHISSTADKAWNRLDHHGKQLDRNAENIATLQQEHREFREVHAKQRDAHDKLKIRVGIIERAIARRLALPAGAGAVGAAVVAGIVELVKYFFGS